MDKVIEVLKDKLTMEQEVRLAKEKAKEKHKSTDSLTNLFMPS
ncbi:hypothetical protein DB41_CG00010 [Neochlamydia sp. TUME1]|nr:hypothetical protein DB41_CG00010 [Neochlamydia sp. TUME1]